MANETKPLGISIRESDTALLDQLAEQYWRTPDQQASAMLEAALSAARARANAPERARGSSRRNGASQRNGVTRVEA
jgi:hypothetical protein